LNQVWKKKEHIERSNKSVVIPCEKSDYLGHQRNLRITSSKNIGLNE